jgi:hypothetical protein
MPLRQGPYHLSVPGKAGRGSLVVFLGPRTALEAAEQVGVAGSKEPIGIAFIRLADYRGNRRPLQGCWKWLREIDCSTTRSTGRVCRLRQVSGTPGP